MHAAVRLCGAEGWVLDVEDRAPARAQGMSICMYIYVCLSLALSLAMSMSSIVAVLFVAVKGAF